MFGVSFGFALCLFFFPFPFRFASKLNSSSVSIVNNIQNDVSEKRVSRPSPFSCTKLVFVSRKGAGIKNKNEEASALSNTSVQAYRWARDAGGVLGLFWFPVLLGRGCENKYLIHSNESNPIRDSKWSFVLVKQPPQIFLRVISSFVERSGRCWCVLLLISHYLY